MEPQLTPVEMDHRLDFTIKRQSCPGPLSLAGSRLVGQALYDPDRFRTRVLARPGGDPLIASAAECESLALDDEALLAFAYRWVAALLRGTARPAPGVSVR